jgi:uncharacterized membrane protein
LESTLKANFSKQQTNDILADYTEFFDTGIADGKSESELCAEFGSPESVAKELFSNYTNQKQSTFLRNLEICFILAAIVILLSLPFL